MVTSQQFFRLIGQQCLNTMRLCRNSALLSRCTLHVCVRECHGAILGPLGCNHLARPKRRLWDEEHLNRWISYDEKVIRLGIPDQTDSFNLSRSIWGLFSCSSIFLILRLVLCFWSSHAVAFIVIASKWGSLTIFLLTTWESCTYVDG